MADEDERDNAKSGSVVGLVGRTVIPCVCEVPETAAHLLTDETASVVSDGVKWQSLYLVFLGRNVILAEPEKGGYVLIYPILVSSVFWTMWFSCCQFFMACNVLTHLYVLVVSIDLVETDTL